MPDYPIKHNTVTAGGTDYLIHSLLDFQQYSAPPRQNGGTLRYLTNQFAAFIDRHTAPSAQAINQDRGRYVDFFRVMAVLAYLFVARRADNFVENSNPFKGRSMTFTQSLELEPS